MATIQKSMDLAVSGIQSVMISNNTYNLSATIQQAIPSGPYTIQWSSSCGGSFSNPTSLTTTFTPPLVGSPSNCVITLKVTDACNRTRFQTFNILVTSGPRPPVANPDSLTFSPDCINVNPAIIVNPLANDSEPDGQPLTISSVTGTNGTWTINPNQTITYIPAPGFYGSTTANYTVCDNTAPTPLCISSTIKITIGVTGQEPVVTDDTYNILEDSIQRINVLANDLPGPIAGALKIAGLVGQPLYGKVSINPDYTITYVPNADNKTADSFYYKAVNNAGYIGVGKVKITFTADGCSAGYYQTCVPGPNPISIIATEDTYINSKNPNNNFGSANVIIVDRENTDKHRSLIRFTLPTLTCNPAYPPVINSAVLKLYKSGGGSVLPVDVYRATNAWNENQATWNDRQTTVSWTTAGGDFDPASIASVNIGGTGLYTWNVTSLVNNWYNDPASYPNNGMLLKTVEGGGDRAPEFVSRENTGGLPQPTLEISYTIPMLCSLIPVRAPLAMPDTAITNSSTPVTLNVVSNDFFPTPGSVSLSIIPGSLTSGSAIVTGNNIVYTPSLSFSGIAYLQYRIVHSISGLSDTATAQIFVTAIPPIANDDVATIYSGDNITVNILANDLDPSGQGYTLNILSGPNVGLMTQNAGNITYTAPFNFYGKDTIIYRILSNGFGLCNETNAADTALFIITVLNRPPVAVNDTASTNPCQSLIIDVLDNDSDPENGSLTVASVSAVSPLDAGTASTDGYRIFFTPNSNYAGASASFTYTIADDATPPAISNPATIIINFSSSLPNRPPLAVNDTVTGIYNNPVFINVTSNDSDPDNDLFDVAIGAGLLMPANGSITLMPNGLIKYTPNNNFFGTDVFEYKITDSHYAPGAGTCSPTSLQSIARVYITINNFYIVLSTRGVRLEGLRAGSHNFLAWTVQENATPYACTLERSFDNIRFDPIYSLQATTASNIHRNYQFSDAAVNLPMAYYRVKITATAQAPVYSNTILIKNQSAENALQVFPVPFNDALTISVFANDIQPMKLALFSSSGTLIQQRSFIPIKGLNLIKLDNLAKLPGNTYFITVSQNNSTLKQKIIKVK
jgi:large repetitive protein